MAQTAPLPTPNDGTTTEHKLVPPDEKFWQHYSPHHELPLSGISSFALHALVLGIIALLLVLSTYLFSHTTRSLPVEVVSLDGSNGSPGNGGVGNMPKPEQPPVEAGGQGGKDPGAILALKPPVVVRKPDDTVQFDPLVRPNDKTQDPDAARTFTNLSKLVDKLRLPDGKGPGDSPGGQGNRPGIGDGSGPGGGTLTQREKRMLRWKMQFNAANGRDYVRQLQGLGAILAIPVGWEGDQPKVRLVRDLGGRPPKLLDEDISKIQRIYWIDKNPQSVADVMQVLHLTLHPSWFIAFMPDELEQKLFAQEKAYLQAKHPGKNEEDIEETAFQILHKGAKYEPKLTWLRVK